jgi:hypothetical protein
VSLALPFDTRYAFIVCRVAGVQLLMPIYCSYFVASLSAFSFASFYFAASFASISAFNFASFSLASLSAFSLASFASFYFSASSSYFLDCSASLERNSLFSEMYF